jgi:hypothetical protein
MRAFLQIVTVVALFLPSQQPRNKSQQPQQPATDKRGTQESPLFVKVIPAPKTQEETEQDATDRKNKTANDRLFVELTGVLAIIAFLQLLVYTYQAKKLRETVESAGEQSKAMERHIGEAARSATAMENIVVAIQAGNKAVLRAYLTVVIGTAIFQERREGQGDLRFEGKPNLVNTGNTPARKVRIRINADILPVPIPEDFNYPLPDEPIKSAEGAVGAHQTYILSGGLVKDFVPEADVANIKEGNARVLCVWGLVTYEDIFGDSHTTKFGQSLTWFPNGQVMGYYLHGQNDVD